MCGNQISRFINRRLQPMTGKLLRRGTPSLSRTGRYSRRKEEHGRVMQLKRTFFIVTSDFIPVFAFLLVPFPLLKNFSKTTLLLADASTTPGRVQSSYQTTKNTQPMFPRDKTNFLYIYTHAHGDIYTRRYNRRHTRNTKHSSLVHPTQEEQPTANACKPTTRSTHGTYQIIKRAELNPQQPAVVAGVYCTPSSTHCIVSFSQPPI